MRLLACLTLLALCPFSVAGPPQAPRPPQAPALVSAVSGCPCGCAVTGVCDCRACPDPFATRPLVASAPRRPARPAPLVPQAPPARPKVPPAEAGKIVIHDPAPTRPAAKSCPCSPYCTCGCNEGGPCLCNSPRAVPAPAYVPPQSYLPPTPAFFAGGGGACRGGG